MWDMVTIDGAKAVSMHHKIVINDVQLQPHIVLQLCAEGHKFISDETMKQRIKCVCCC